MMKWMQFGSHNASSSSMHCLPCSAITLRQHYSEPTGVWLDFISGISYITSILIQRNQNFHWNHLLAVQIFCAFHPYLHRCRISSLTAFKILPTAEQFTRKQISILLAMKKLINYWISEQGGSPYFTSTSYSQNSVCLKTWILSLPGRAGRNCNHIIHTRKRAFFALTTVKERHDVSHLASLSKWQCAADSKLHVDVYRRACSAAFPTFTPSSSNRFIELVTVSSE